MTDTFVYDPDADKVPEGRYLCKFLGVEDVVLEKESKWNQAGEVRLRWTFEVLEGPCQGKKIDPLSKTSMASSKSTCFKILSGLMGRLPQPRETISWRPFVGRVYKLKWCPNLDTDTKALHIADMEAVPTGAPPGAPPPPPPAAPPAPPSAPPSDPARQFWVILTPGESPVQMDEAHLTKVLHEKGMAGDEQACDTVQVTLVGGAGKWAAASQYGFPNPSQIPF